MSPQDTETHVKIVAWLHIILSALGLLVTALVILVFVGIGLLLAATDGTSAMGIWVAVGTFIGVFLFLVSVPGLIGGIGLLQRQNWARILVLILSVLQLFNFSLWHGGGGVFAVGAYTCGNSGALWRNDRLERVDCSCRSMAKD
ncbi:MAG: hypothetical protein OXE05_10235 [Chloroflexi bacterium]|nr:hypothetical protein [Chloroflexota bacterium]